ncbi:predicted protein [Naegleria gruberi]|uniref:Predicted protein n=1 Tax=Naegleria gruberi TaxID=5762 RepID=D2VWC6_NAEGR|nr:uncharacterized protein NAEGRDRAFT_52781 [Naegleria gruberi]EFC38810.1 predicted protein [Naegleria gruberi]|eukprot:XP_002671554.1 predicted protein [Naegleria gruberi strain NEG-M]
MFATHNHNNNQFVRTSQYEEEENNDVDYQGVTHVRRMIPIIFNNQEVGYEAFVSEAGASFDQGNSSSSSATTPFAYDDEYDDISPEEQQRCPTMLIYLKGSNGVKRKILQDITWELYHFDGLMMRIGKLFPQEEQVKISCVIGKSRKVAIQNDDDWQHALQQLLLNDETMIKIFIKSQNQHQQSKKKNKNLLQKIVDKQEKQQARKHFKQDALIDTSSIRNVYIDAGSILLHVRDLKSLAFNSDKDIAEKTLLRLAKSLHQTESFNHVHVFFNSTMNVQPEENEAGTFVVSIAEPFSTSGDLMKEFLNRQIIAGALESCLVVSCDRVLLKDLNDYGDVKVCNARSWFRICQHSDELMMTNNHNNSKDWLRNILVK